MVSAYLLDYQNFVCIPRQMEENFKEMADMGYDSICVTFSESEMQYSRRSFEIVVDTAHKCGLKVNVIPSRIAGRFAGAPLMPSRWLVSHPEFAVPDDYWLPAACLEVPETREFVKSFMSTLINDYDLDGIIWDEPKAPTLISHHPATIAKYGENPTMENMALGFCDFFEDITAHCHNLNPNLVQTLFCIKTEEEFFTSNIAKNPYIEYFGYDGNLCKQRRFHEEIAWSKYRIETAWERTLKECKDAGKKTFALVETMHTPREEHKNFEVNFENYLQNYHPDHLSVYYYAHNCDAPDEFNEIVKKVMKKYLK